MTTARVEYELIGRRIRYYRKLRKLTQDQLAEAVNIAPNYVSMIETGYKKSSLEVLVSICNALDITMDTLFRDTQKANYLSTQQSMLEDLFSDCTEEETLFVIDAMSSIIDTLHRNRYTLNRVDV